MRTWLEPCCVLGLASLALVLHGCEGQVGPCAGGECPHVPGCAGSVTCDPDHVCLEQVCEGVAWICGVASEGNYSWLRKSAPCDDGDPCTVNDLCVSGQCVGNPMSCDNPPANTCLDETTLKTWKSEGLCKEGACVYASTEFTCPKGCQGGMCVGAPCLGVVCDNPGPCEESPGVCDEGTGKCLYTPKPVGSTCDPGDKCIPKATCDALQQCSGPPIDCSKPNTTGATCVPGTGVCQGYSCTAGYGNCNNSWDDGCETPLNTLTHCGSCTVSCGNVAHATPSCLDGKCVPQCTSPYKDCDKDYKTGCEIPVGVANKCNRKGLASFTGTTPPCGTAYCGKHATDDAHQDHGTWYCKFCAHCHDFNGGGSWCLYSLANHTPHAGNFSSDRCVPTSSCCNPSSSTYPPVCK